MALALTLSACAGAPWVGSDGGPRAFNPLEPKVKVVAGRPTIDQDILAFAVTPNKPADIVWKLDSSGGYTFAEQGIRIEGEVVFQAARDGKPPVLLNSKQDEIGKCAPVGTDGKAFKCENRRSKAGIYKYTIQLKGPDGPVELDPVIANW